MLGERIRQERLNKDMNLGVLAELTGLSSGFISQVERGLAEPSITSVRKIARALEIPMFRFFVEEKEVLKVVRKGKRQKVRFEPQKMSYELLTPDLGKQLEGLIGRLECGGTTSEAPETHEGEELTYVLSGYLGMQLGDDYHELAEGDCIYYFGGVPHKLTNIGDQEAVFLTVITPPRF